MDLVAIANSRIAEPLSKGVLIKKLLALHISPYTYQMENNEILENLKNIDKTSGSFLEWFGVLKGIQRPKRTVTLDKETHFFNAFTFDNVGFSDNDISKPLYFNQENYYEIGDPEFRLIIKSYCFLTNFKGTIDEYSYFFNEIFNIVVQIRLINHSLVFIIENSNQVTLDKALLFGLTPTLPQTDNNFKQSPYSLFSLQFDNIKGTDLNFDEDINSSLYFLF